MSPDLGKEGTFAQYVDREAKHPFEVEHIWAKHYSRHVDEFDNEHEFSQHRNRLGDLVLLPKDFNASYGDLPYDDKVIQRISEPARPITEPPCVSEQPVVPQDCRRHWIWLPAHRHVRCGGH